MLYLISYDLNAPGQDYSRVHAAIESCGPAINCLKSVWMVHSQLTADQIQTVVRASSDSNDFFVVIDITGQSRDGWLRRSYWDWMRAHDY